MVVKNIAWMIGTSIDNYVNWQLKTTEFFLFIYYNLMVKIYKIQKKKKNYKIFITKALMDLKKK